tara:strand:- start:8397 stop:8585 length:189 start_codon:yes stop_codon:yes gene_type:complete
MCKKRGKGARLAVHHIMKWSSAASLRYDIDNGITLCKVCHESITGKENHYIAYLVALLKRNK